jgi:hypothetical protein
MGRGLKWLPGMAALVLVAGTLAACDATAVLPEGGLLPGWIGGGETGEKKPDAPAVSMVSNELPPPLPEPRGKVKAAAPAVAAPVAPAPDASQVKTAATGSTEASSESGGLPSLGRLFSGLGGSETVTSAQAPVLVYAALAREIKRCWLTPDAPRLANHIFQADASTRQGGSAKITIYEKREGVRFGPEAFAVTIAPESGGSVVSSENARLPSDVSGALQRDVARWSKGQEGCAP